MITCYTLSIVLEGLLTTIVGLMSFWIVQDFPDTAKFLTETERTFIIRRLQDDDQFSAAGEEFRLKYILASLKDLKTYVGSKIYLLLLIFGAEAC